MAKRRAAVRRPADNSGARDSRQSHIVRPLPMEAILIVLYN